MTKIDQTHFFSETICTHTNSPCPAMGKMLRALAGALDKARPTTQEDFEISGESRLDGCSRQCAARFFASHERIRVFCDVNAEADQNRLDQFADMLLSPTSSGLPASGLNPYPCALGEALHRPVHMDTPAAPLSARY